MARLISTFFVQDCVMENPKHLFLSVYRLPGGLSRGFREKNTASVSTQQGRFGFYGLYGPEFRGSCCPTRQVRVRTSGFQL